MVTTVTSYTDPIHRALPGNGYDGVVRVSAGGYYGSGVLLSDGRAVLTAAHLFEDGLVDTEVTFETLAGTETLAARAVLVHPNYDAANNNHDLALVWLGESAPVAAERYGLYRDTDEIGQVFEMVGYGLPGTGGQGADEEYSGAPMRLKASNRFDADPATLKANLGSGMGWTPLAGTQLVADFDNGRYANDALGRLIARVDTGLGLDEGLIAPGDSGSPALVDGLVAGIASYTASLGTFGAHPDINDDIDSSYGEIASWQRVSESQEWIDQSLRAAYLDAPTTPAEVQKAVAEGQDGTSLAYFLLQFTGVRDDPEQLLSVEYATRDGTAVAGEDYVAISGKLVLYPDENQAVIPVEIVGETAPELDESFYLDVFNPVGGSFGDGVVQLTAVRTIVNDDGWAI